MLGYAHDNDGRQTLIRDGLGNEIQMEYDDVSAGACTSCSGGGGAGSQPTRIIYPTFIKEFRYDERGRKIAELDIVDGETQTTSFSYDPAGNLIAQTDKAGQTTSYSYDALNRLTGVTDAAGTTSYTYNPLGNLTSLTDARSQTTNFSYDRNGRLITEIRPMSRTTSYSYDGAGNLIEKEDANGQTTTYGYDDAGRLAQIHYADSTVTFGYDNAGNLTSYDDGVTSGSYSYNALNQKLSETVTYPNFSKSFSYDYSANSLKKSFTMPDGTAYEYTYGDNNELREIRLPGTGSISYPSYTWTRPDAVQYPGGGRREYEYDALMRLKHLIAKDPGGNILLDYSYEYDSIGNIVSKTTEHGTYSYGYDGASRLTSAENPTLGDEAYSYDALGNRTNASNADGSITHNANNELTMYGDVEYVYDANGNMTEVTLSGQVMFSYHYNADNRLVKVEGGNNNTIAEYYYDPFGRRLWKEVAGTRTYFFYADEGLVAEYTVSGTELRSYGYQPDSTWTTDPLFLKQGSEYYFYQNDHLGTPQKLVAQNGAVVWAATYTAFGEATVEMETITNNLRFPGQYFDAETGLHYNLQRYYDPRVGRYIQTDPTGLKGGINLFAYAMNNAERNTDPLGLWVHPHQIIPPDEAFYMVENAFAITNARYQDYDVLGHGPTFRELMDVGGFPGRLTEGRYERFIDFMLEHPEDSDFFLLYSLTRITWPGGVRGMDGYHNRFVFTCKQGWIDMGHFFESALWGYWLEREKSWVPESLDRVGIWWAEFQQYGKGIDLSYWLLMRYIKPRATRESAFTPEDISSNSLGIQFGRELARTVEDLRKHLCPVPKGSEKVKSKLQSRTCPS